MSKLIVFTTCFAISILLGLWVGIAAELTFGLGLVLGVCVAGITLILDDDYIDVDAKKPPAK